MIVLLFTCLGLMVTLLLRLLRKRRRLLKMTKNVPTLAGEVPIIGHIHLLLDTMRRTLHSPRNLDEFAGIRKMWLGPSKLGFLVSDPKISLKLLNTCLNKLHTYHFAASWIGQGLLTAPADHWKRTRKMLNPTFHQQVLNNFLKIFNEQSKILVENLRDQVGKGDFNQGRYLRKTGLESICQTAIALPKANKIVDDEYIKAVDRMQDIHIVRFKTLWMHLNFLYRWSSNNKEEHKVVKILKAFSSNALKQKRIELAVSGNKKSADSNRFKAFMDLLLELEEDGSLTDAEIQDEVNTIILAGFDTSSTLLMFTMAMLKQYPKVQDKVFKELKELFGDGEPDITKDDLSKLVYLEAVIKETGRMWPIVPFIGRESDTDVKFDDFTLPAGSSIFISIWGMQRDGVWGDPEVFRPERWLDPASTPKDNFNSYALFGMGKRACIGKVYAMMSMKTTLAHVLRRYEILGSTDVQLVPKLDSLMRPKKGHWIQIKER